MLGITKPALIVAAGAALAVAAPASSAFADGGHGGDSVVNAALTGSTPNVSPTIAGIKPGGAPWVNQPSFARVRESGATDVSIHGLIIPGRGNPIPSVVATLVCGDMVAGSTIPFALSPTGDGSTHDMIAVPEECEHGRVLIQPAANRAVYIASTPADDDD